MERFLGFEPRVAWSQLPSARLCAGALVRPLCVRGNAGRAPSVHQSLHPCIRHTTEEKSRKNLSRGSRKVLN